MGLLADALSPPLECGSMSTPLLGELPVPVTEPGTEQGV